MANEIVKTNGAVQKIEFSKDQVALIKQQIAPKATDTELQLFLYQCQRTGLDPLTRQIYCIHRKEGQTEKMTIQTSIDGFRVIAERSGAYAGQSEPEFQEGMNGQLICCKVRVYKFGPNAQRYEAAVGVAYWDEYVQTKDEWVNGQKTNRKVPAAMWAKMPHTMLAKVAEALALRKAFPQDLSGLYTSDEMLQGETTEEGVITGVTTDTANNGNGEKPTVITQPSGQKKGAAKKEDKPEEPKQDAPPPPPPGKKWVSEKAFNDAMGRIKAGEWDVVIKMGAVFAFNESQQIALKEVVDNIFAEAVVRIEKGEAHLVAQLRDSLPLSEEQQQRLDALIGADLPF